MVTRVKICGITRIEDALAAAAAGADAIGLVFAESPRRVTGGQAQAIVAALPPFIKVVGLFVDAPAEHVRAVLNEVSLDLLQFHGREQAADCRQFGRPYLKAIHIKEGEDAGPMARRYPDAAALLFDTHRPDVAGGSGVTFDWSRLPDRLDRPVILAGGLTPENVTEAVRAVRPYAVDVSSGVERSKGIKDAEKIAAFVRNAKIV